MPNIKDYLFRHQLSFLFFEYFELSKITMQNRSKKRDHESIFNEDVFSQYQFKQTNQQIQINRSGSAIKDFAHGRTRMSIADVIKYFVFVTVSWIIQAAILFRVKLLRGVLFIGAVRDFELFVLISDV